jgi:adenine-specific DNA-methyltransferase
MMQLNGDYQREDFLKFIEEDFLTDFKKDIRPVNISGLSSIIKANYLGESKDLDLQVFEFLFEGSPNKRVALTKDAFSVMRSSAIFKALAIFHSPDSKDWRFSLMTATPEPTEKGKVSLSYSNPKRLSFFLGPDAKINTPTKFLVSKGKITDFEDLKTRFSIEVVNKEFYKEISQAFTKLVSGLLKLPSSQDKSQTNLEFAVRLIGRIIFCWFLREKESQAGLPLMPKALLSFEAAKENTDYYHKILEPIFFEVLNKKIDSRIDEFTKGSFASIPYLNGGLFSQQDDDFYKRVDGDFQSQYHNTLVIPDTWFKEFFEILETYNFTIDENTSYDEELSIDPEMLGRIFENLLAEINPDTGESARKNTGSYYTPRVIVNFMIDKSLLIYLKKQTGINEEKLSAVISYDLNDDADISLTSEEKAKIINALEKVRIFDPACGSGAFPIGALQKIVFILQQTDPDGKLWFKKQIESTSPEIKRVIEREFEHKNFDYIRKLGIIRENIYGVDIQPIATEISRLRCFLTLVVDQHIQDDLYNRGVEPLPNLDFKFVTANSILGLPEIDVSQQELFDNNQKIDQLKLLRDQYFTAKNDERKDVMIEFSDMQSEMINELIDKHSFTGVVKAELTRKLTEWKPFKHKLTGWFDPEWMFGIKDGFDIVIANPPYGVSLKGDLRKDVLRYSDKVPDYEIFYFFIEHAYKFLEKSGVLAYIIPNTILFNVFADSYRKGLLSKYEMDYVVDCTNIKIFEHATVRNCILILSKEPQANTVGYIKTADVTTLEELFAKDTSYMPKQYLLENNANWGLAFKLDNKVLKLVDKIKRNKALSNYYPEISQGLIAYDKYQGQSNEIIKKRAYHHFDNPNGKYKKWLYGEDINKFVVRWNLKEYIDYCQGIANPRQPKYFIGERVLVREITSPSIYAAYTEEELYNDPSILIIKASASHSAKYLTAILNSKLATFYHFNSSPKATKGDFPKILIKDIQNFPLVIGDDKDIRTLETLVAEIESLTKSNNYNLKNTSEKQLEIERKIDAIVYRMYDLKKEEINIIQNINE